MAEAAIAAEGLGKRSGPLLALDSVGLELPAGGVLVLLGPNGAGKTPTVRIPASGIVFYPAVGVGAAALAPLLTRFTTWSLACAAAQTATLTVVAAAFAART